MEKNKATFLFLKYGMDVGGIENYLYNLIHYLRKHTYRVLYLALKGTKIHEDFIPNLCDGYVEVVEIDIHEMFWEKKLKGIIRKEEMTIAYAFDLYQYAMLEKLKICLKLKKMHSFLWIPHFNGYFMEEEFPNFIRKIVFSCYRKLIIQLDKNRNIIYVNQSHKQEFEKHYYYQSVYGDEMLIHAFREAPTKFDKKKAENRSKRNPFRIISVGRFVFPHKAYLFGLIDSFAKIKEKYSDIKLTIIGYGKDEGQIRKKLIELPEYIKRDITLIGKVAPSELNHYFEDASVHIGVAGAILDSAYDGLISVPVRHESYICEGYGYFTDIKQIELLTEKKPGIEITSFIKELYEMKESDYIELCKKTQSLFSNADAYRNYGIREMSQRNIDCTLHLPKIFIIFVQIRFVLADISHRMVRGKNGE